ncbi:unnamed protein product [Cyclocybe aegerita]|uniref:Uncharacterized protein n=1 Tax=Cyclocybe aegerita TaxID=1973307 RepID=A0A8S0VTI5_CYCAE|nr:unnamed protein product [Cyclocybe aegerita]
MGMNSIAHIEVCLYLRTLPFSTARRRLNSLTTFTLGYNTPVNVDVAEQHWADNIRIVGLWARRSLVLIIGIKSVYDGHRSSIALALSTFSQRFLMSSFTRMRDARGRFARPKPPRMETSHSTYLPAEVIRVILEGLIAQNDQPSVEAFSRVSSFFLEDCRKHLMQAFDLRKAPRGNPYTVVPATQMMVEYITRFAVLLQRQPHLAGYVKKIRIFCDDSNQNLSWIKQRTAMPFILDRIPQVTDLELTLEEPVEWAHFDPELRRAFLAVMCRGMGVTQLKITGVRNLPMMLLNQSRSLKSMELHTCTFIFPDISLCPPEEQQLMQRISQGLSRKTYLDELTVGNSGVYIGVALATDHGRFLRVDISRLKRLEIDLGRRPPENVEAWKIVLFARKSIQTLVVRQTDMEFKPALLIQMPNPGQFMNHPLMKLWHLEQLTHFDLTVVFQSLERYEGSSHRPILVRRPPQNCYEQPLIPWAMILWAGNKMLRTITLTLECYALEDEELFSTCFEIETDHTTGPGPYPPIPTSWSLLDTALKNPNAFPSLQQIDVVMKLPEASSSMSDAQAPISALQREVMSVIKKLLHETRRRVVLNIRCELD